MGETDTYLPARRRALFAARTRQYGIGVARSVSPTPALLRRARICCTFARIVEVGRV